MTDMSTWMRYIFYPLFTVGSSGAAAACALGPYATLLAGAAGPHAVAAAPAVGRAPRSLRALKRVSPGVSGTRGALQRCAWLRDCRLAF